MAGDPAEIRAQHLTNIIQENLFLRTERPTKFSRLSASKFESGTYWTLVTTASRDGAADTQPDREGRLAWM